LRRIAQNASQMVTAFPANPLRYKNVSLTGLAGFLLFQDHFVGTIFACCIAFKFPIGLLLFAVGSITIPRIINKWNCKQMKFLSPNSCS